MPRKLRNPDVQSEDSDGDESGEGFYDDEEREEESHEDSEDEEDEEQEDDFLIPSDKEEDDSDAAPDDVEFSVSKKLVLKSMKNAVNVLKQEQESIKNKRKKKDEMFLQQKKQKLAELEKNKLPDDLLEAISDKPLGRHREETIEVNSKNTKVTFLEQEEELVVNTPEFIPLNSSKGLVVQPVTASDKKLDKSALDFRKEALYGGRIKRIDAQAMQRQEAKQKARHIVIN